jgi:hypothetical protein
MHAQGEPRCRASRCLQAWSSSNRCHVQCAAGRWSFPAALQRPARFPSCASSDAWSADTLTPSRTIGRANSERKGRHAAVVSITGGRADEGAVRRVLIWFRPRRSLGAPGLLGLSPRQKQARPLVRFRAPACPQPIAETEKVETEKKGRPYGQPFHCRAVVRLNCCDNAAIRRRRAP